MVWADDGTYVAFSLQDISNEERRKAQMVWGAFQFGLLSDQKSPIKLGVFANLLQ